MDCPCIEGIGDITTPHMGSSGLNERGSRLDNLACTLEESLDRVPGQSLSFMVARVPAYTLLSIRRLLLHMKATHAFAIF